jgi:translation initiation factor 3 subunit L
MYSDDEYSSFGHTGDPTMDRTKYFPEPVKKFHQYFQDMIKEGNAYEINNLYENNFPKLTEHFFKTSTWPEGEDIACYVADAPISLNPPYGELYSSYDAVNFDNDALHKEPLRLQLKV